MAQAILSEDRPPDSSALLSHETLGVDRIGHRAACARCAAARAQWVILLEAMFTFSLATLKVAMKLNFVASGIRLKVASAGRNKILIVRSILPVRKSREEFRAGAQIIMHRTFRGQRPWVSVRNLRRP